MEGVLGNELRLLGLAIVGTATFDRLQGCVYILQITFNLYNGVGRREGGREERGREGGREKGGREGGEREGGRREGGREGEKM